MAERPVAQLLKEKKICEIINPKLVQAPPSISIEQAVTIMQQNGSGYIVIAEQNKPIGIFTENDLVFKILGQGIDWNRPVSDLMTKNPKVLRTDDSVGQAIDIMGEHRFYHIPLVDAVGNLVNVISVRTLIRFLAEFYPAEIMNLPPNVNQIIETAEGG